METLVERCAGLDVHKNTVMACVRVPGPNGGRISTVHQFRTFTAGLRQLRDWLVAEQVSQVVMEATGDYRKGPFYRLEAEGFECVLADAKQVRHLPGRPKRDPADSRWLAACFERGTITACFVATPEFRLLRGEVDAPRPLRAAPRAGPSWRGSTTASTPRRRRPPRRRRRPGPSPRTR